MQEVKAGRNQGVSLMLSGQSNTKKQGDVGMGVAIAYFSIMGYTISIPLTDSQDYDLVADIDDKLYKVQVKTTTFKNSNGSFRVNLRVFGGNRSGQSVKHFDNKVVDYLFVVTEDGDKYFIPSNFVETTNQLTLNYTFDKFKVSL